MPKSAFMGHPSISSKDKMIYRGLFILMGQVFFEALAEQPHNSHDDDKTSSLITGSSFAIVLVILITCLRLWIRKFLLRSFNLGDWIIIPAIIGCITFLSLDIASETAGCLGKHINNCTYDEFDWTYEVSDAWFKIFNAK